MAKDSPVMEKVLQSVIPSGARNLSSIYLRETKDEGFLALLEMTGQGVFTQSGQPVGFGPCKD
jgi:hypothetical protein